MAEEIANRSSQVDVFPHEQPVTALLERWRSGDQDAQDALLQTIYPYMRQLASANLRRLGDGLMQSTELAHEAFLRLNLQQTLDWKSRAHFLAVIATVTRNVVIDLIRERNAAKRGGNEQHTPVDELVDLDQPHCADSVFDWIALDQALTLLAKEDTDCAKVAEAKLFSSMEVGEISEALGISPATIGRHWRFAKSWLVKQLELDLTVLRD